MALIKQRSNFLLHLVIVVVLVASVLVPIALPAGAQGGTIYVREGSVGSGTSWADAYGDLQSALDTANAEDDIWVSAGTYVPTEKYDGTTDRHRAYQMKNGVGIYGGFSASGSPSWNDRNWQTYETILSGEILNPGSPDNCYHIFYHPTGTNLDATAILDGFTLTLANADGYGGDEYYGGGMYNEDSDPLITNCVFLENYGYQGAGIYNLNSDPTFVNCIFDSNVSLSRAGAIYNYNSSAAHINCIFYLNDASTGSAIYQKNEGAGESPFVNCIFDENVGNDITIDLAGGSVDVTYCNVEGGSSKPWFGTGCIDTDPLWVDPSNGDFHLQSTSPCVDTGSNTAIQSTGITIDFEKDDRVIEGNTVPGARVDMGVDELAPPPATLTIDQTGQCCDVRVVATGVDQTVTAGNSAGISITYGDNVILTASGCHFDSWAGTNGGEATGGNPGNLFMSGDKSVTASCYVELTVDQTDECCDVDVAATGVNQTVAAGNSEVIAIQYGDNVTLTPSECNFNSWAGTNGGEVTGGNPGTLYMDSDKAITADCFSNLTVDQTGQCCDMRVEATGIDQIVTAGNSAVIPIQSVENVTLSPSGCNFDTWAGANGGEVTGGNPGTLYVDEDKSVTASCLEAYSVTIECIPRIGLRPDGQYLLNVAIYNTGDASYSPGDGVLVSGPIAFGPYAGNATFTTASGKFTYVIPELVPAGNDYVVVVSAWSTLENVRDEVDISGNTTIDMGTLTSGNYNTSSPVTDAEINNADMSPLANGWGCSTGQTCYTISRGADSDEDGNIGNADMSPLANNWGIKGPVDIN